MPRFVQIALIFSIFTIASISAAAATFTVTKTADTNDSVCDADCSFREAVGAANATVDNDIVAFSSLFDSPQTIVLSLGEIAIANNGSLTIQGPGADKLTLDGNQTSRILVTGANVVANVDGIRFTRGNGVGAINSGRGGAIYNVGGTMVLSNSILIANTAANGGALNNAASSSPTVPANITIIDCIFDGNTSTSSGGAFQNFSTSTINIRGSSVINNTSNSTGIAGAFQANGFVTITNSTFSGNASPAGTGGGVYFNGSSLIMTNTTITANSSSLGGGGLHRTGTTLVANVRNTIIAGNSGAAATPDAFGAITSQGNNLVGNVGASTGWVASDILDQPANLGPLAANGGPTPTHALLPGSPAIDAGNNCVIDLSCGTANPPVAVTTDQRGNPRPAGPTVDIGSVEQAAPVRVAGRVLIQPGQGNPRAIVTISDGGSLSISIPTSGFGYFSFEGIPAGVEYTVSVSSKLAPYGSQVITPSSDITDMEFLPAIMMKQ